MLNEKERQPVPPVPANPAEKCPNGPDRETGEWPCDPVDNGDGTATCSTCGFVGNFPPVPARREPAAETDGRTEEALRVIRLWVKTYSVLSIVEAALVREQEAREDDDHRWRSFALAQNEIVRDLKRRAEQAEARVKLLEAQAEAAEARLRVAHAFIPADKRVAYEEACALAEEALFLHRGSHDA